MPWLGLILSSCPRSPSQLPSQSQKNPPIFLPWHSPSYEGLHAVFAGLAGSVVQPQSWCQQQRQHFETTTFTSNQQRQPAVRVRID